MESIAQIAFFLDGISYVGIFLLIVFSGYIVPVPEELFLIVIGYLIYAGVFDPVPVFLVVLVAALVHDHLLYRLGAVDNARAKWFLEQITQWTLLNREDLVKKHLLRVVFYSRFLPYVRMAGPLLAGFHAVPWKRFAVVNAAAVLLYVPLSLLVGYHFHGAIEQVIARVTVLHHVGLLLLLLVLGSSVGWYIGKTLKLERTFIAVMELRLQTWLPLLLVLLLLGGYSLFVRSPNITTLTYDVGSLAYVDASERFELRYLFGFTVATSSSMFGGDVAVVFLRGNDTVPDEIVFRAHPVVAGMSAEEVILRDAISESGGQLDSLRDLTELKIGGAQWFYLRRSLHEGQLHVTYYAIENDVVYSATLLEDRIADWMNPSFDEYGTPGHGALRYMLATFTPTYVQ